MFFRFLLILVVVIGLSFSGCRSSSSSSDDNRSSEVFQQYKDTNDTNETITYNYQSTKAEDGNYSEITLTRAFQIPSDALFIDVRNDWERKLDDGYPAGSLNAVYEWRTPNASRTAEDTTKQRSLNSNFVDDVLKLANGDKSKHIILICHSGSRTKKAAKLLAENGFTNVEHIIGGFNAWNANDLPVEHFTN